VAGIQKHGTGAFCEGLDATFGNAILMMSIDAAESNRLFGCVDGRAELLGGKDAVVTVVVFDTDVMPMVKALKGSLGFKSVVSVGGFLGVDVIEAGCVVNEDGSNEMSLFHEFACCLSNKAGDLGDELVDGDNVTRLEISGRKMATVMGSSPRLALGLAEEASGALGDATMCDLLGEGTLSGRLLEASKGEVPKAKVVGHEEVFFWCGLARSRRRIVVVEKETVVALCRVRWPRRGVEKSESSSSSLIWTWLQGIQAWKMAYSCWSRSERAWRMGMPTRL
jgi:hypothetical protein